jgi:NADH-quinone oxidoreductase subunit M
MNQAWGFPILTLVVFLPLLGGLASLLFKRAETRNWLALLTSAANLFIALFLYMGWTNDPSGSPQFVDGPWPWIHSLGIHYYLGVDGINLHLVLLTAFLVPLALLAAAAQDGAAPTRSSFAFWALFFESGMLGATTSLDLMLCTFFWVMALLATFFLLGEGVAQSRGAARFMVAVAPAAALMSASTIGLSALQPGFGLPELLARSLPWRAQAWLFWGTLLPFGLTGAIFPLHLWYPDAHRQASPAARVLASALLLNLGAYGLIRFSTLPFPLATTAFAPLLLVVGAVGTAYGALAALRQRTFLGTLACWNLSQVSLTLVGIFALQDLALHGAIMHMVARGLSMAALLFLSAPHPHLQQGDRSQQSVSIPNRAALALGLLSAVGLPGLAGFAGQGTLLRGVLRWHWNVSRSAAVNRACDWAFYALVVSGILVGIWTLVRAWRHEYASAEGSRVSRQTVIAIPILLLTLLLGVHPQPSTSIIRPSVSQWFAALDRGVDRDLLRMAPPLSPAEGQVPTPLPPGSGEPVSSARRPAVNGSAPFRSLASLYARDAGMLEPGMDSR